MKSPRCVGCRASRRFLLLLDPYSLLRFSCPRNWGYIMVILLLAAIQMVGGLIIIAGEYDLDEIVGALSLGLGTLTLGAALPSGTLLQFARSAPHRRSHSLNLARPPSKARPRASRSSAILTLRRLCACQSFKAMDALSSIPRTIKLA